MLSLQGGSSPYDYNHSRSPSTTAFEHQARSGRKRKADLQQDNDRLSKRLGRLNIAGQNLRNLYATVEDDASSNRPPAPPNGGPSPAGVADEHMHLDDTSHKVYIYNIDDELSSDSEPEDGRLIFLPDIERALLANRIPPIVRADPDGRLAGKSIEDMQVVLYNVPTSLTVAPEHDSVRKAVIEARARARARRGQATLESEAEAAPAKESASPALFGSQPLMAGAAPTAGLHAANIIPEDVDAMDLS